MDFGLPAPEPPTAAEQTYGWHWHPAEADSVHSDSGSDPDLEDDLNDEHDEREVEAQVLERRRRASQAAENDLRNQLWEYRRRAAQGDDGVYEHGGPRRRGDWHGPGFGDEDAFRTDSDTDTDTDTDTESETGGGQGQFAGAEERPQAAQQQQEQEQEQEQEGNNRAREEEQQDAAVCRICFDDGNDLGRLISPCKCKGTMKYVHSTCLDQWRALSVRNSSSVACDQCGAPYRFRRSRFVGLATSPPLLLAVTILLFTTLIWSAGFVASFIIDVADSDVQRYDDTGATKPPCSDMLLDALLDDDDDDDLLSYTWLDYPVYTPHVLNLVHASMRQFGAGMPSMVRQFITFTGDGDAEGDGDGEGEAQEGGDPWKDPHNGGWDQIVGDWIYGNERAVPTKDGKVDAGEIEEHTTGSVTDEHEAPAAEAEASHRGPKAQKERYDARQAEPVTPDSDPSRSPTDSQALVACTPTPAHARQTWIEKLTYQFGLGTGLVGITSFMNMLIGVNSFGPFHLGRGLARMTGGANRGGGRRGGGGGNEGVNLASVVLVLLVIIGIIRALHSVWKVVNAIARRLLSRVEEAIVDWGGEDEVPRAAAPGPGPAPAPPAQQVENAQGQARRRFGWMLARAGD